MSLNLRKNLLICAVLVLAFSPASAGEAAGDSSITFPPGTPDRIEKLFIALGENPPDGVFMCQPGYGRVFYTREMIDIANSPCEAIPILMANIDHPTVGNPAIEILGDLRVKEAVDPLIGLLRRARSSDSETEVGLILNVLAKITQHPKGYRFFREAFRPEVIDEAIAEYGAWYESHNNRPETELLTGELYGSGYPKDEFYLPRIPLEPERNWQEIPESGSLIARVKQLDEARKNKDLSAIYELSSPAIKQEVSYSEFIAEYRPEELREARICGIKPFGRSNVHGSKYFFTEVTVEITAASGDGDPDSGNQADPVPRQVSEIWVYVNGQWYCHLRR